MLDMRVGESKFGTRNLKFEIDVDAESAHAIKTDRF